MQCNWLHCIIVRQRCFSTLFVLSKRINQKDSSEGKKIEDDQKDRRLKGLEMLIPLQLMYVLLGLALAVVFCTPP